MRLFSGTQKSFPSVLHTTWGEAASDIFSRATYATPALPFEALSGVND